MIDEKIKLFLSDNGKKHISESPHWEEIQEIRVSLLPVEKLNPQILPFPIRGYIQDIAERMCCPVDFPAITTIVTLASLVGTRLTIKPKQKDSWIVVPNLWGGIIAPPSKLKTPSMAEVLTFLNRLTNNKRKEYEEATLEYQTEKIAFEAKKEAFRVSEKNKALGKSHTTIDLPAQPIQPVETRYMTNDTTTEKLGELLNENPHGLLIFRDELIGLLASWEKSGREADRAFFLEAWNGNGSSTVDRIGRGTIHIANCCVSLLGGIQPTKLMGYLESAQGYENDGLLQRFQLLVYPDEISWKLIDRYPNVDEKNRFWKVFQDIVTTDYSLIAEKNEWEKFYSVHFSPEAQELFYQWLTELETEKLSNKDEHYLITEHLAKYRSLMPSLALVFQAVEGFAGSGNYVSEECTMKAIEWCKYLESHARRIYGMTIHSGEKSAQELSEKIREGKLKNGFSARDVYEKGWFLLSEPESAKNAINRLIDANWIRVIETENRVGRKSEKYEINPEILVKA